MTAAPGLAIGPQDVDSAGELVGDLGVHNKAESLLQRHAALYPADLRIALARPRDYERSATLDLDEVQEVLAGLKGSRAFFDPDSHVLEDASVKGQGDTFVVSVVYRSQTSGRSGRGAITYDDLSRSQSAFADLKQKQAEAIERPAEAASARAADRGEVERLHEAEKTARESQEALAALQERLTRLENPEPFDGYDELSAEEVISRVRDDGHREFGRAGLERMLTYERATKNRKTVVGAIRDAHAEASR